MRENMQIRRGESGVPFSEITGREIERTLGRTLQEKATNWMRLNLQGKSFENDATGWDIAVGRKGINKAMSHGARDVHARSAAAIPALLKDAILAAREQNKNPTERDDISLAHHFYAPLRVDGKEYVARLVVRKRVIAPGFTTSRLRMSKPRSPQRDPSLLPKKGRRTEREAQ